MCFHCKIGMVNSLDKSQLCNTTKHVFLFHPMLHLFSNGGRLAFIRSWNHGGCCCFAAHFFIVSGSHSSKYYGRCPKHAGNWMLGLLGPKIYTYMIEKTPTPHHQKTQHCLNISSGNISVVRRVFRIATRKPNFKQPLTAKSAHLTA